MSFVYRNRWMPDRVLALLAATDGPILDVGGAAGPYGGASHILDILPYDPDRLTSNAWGRVGCGWSSSHYTSFDLCSTRRWPFPDKSFALGLCSHALEDLRDPLPALAEMGRVCQQLLIVAPSRLVEQTYGVDHPRFAGFAHHPWMVTHERDRLCFRRKTAYLGFPGCSFRLPLWRTLRVEAGTFVYHGLPIEGEEIAFWEGEEEIADLQGFVAENQGQFQLSLEVDPRWGGAKRKIYWARQRFFGVP